MGEMQMESLNTKIRFAYLSYSDMLSKIESGELDAYDIIFSKDKLTTYLVSENLEPIEMRSKVYVYNSVSQAEEELNKNSDTYIGQVVSILCKDVYRGYIVNQKEDKFYVTPLWEHPEPIDYDTLGNRPIVNMYGTIDNPIIVSSLDSGTYKIRGQFKVSELEETVYLSGSEVLFIVKNKNNVVNIKMITSDNITDYEIKDDTISANKYVTEKYLTENGYTTTSYVDNKIKALELSIKEDMEKYISDVISEIMTDNLNEMIDSRIDEKIQPTTNKQIESLF